jgi:hypothetical protein
MYTKILFISIAVTINSLNIAKASYNEIKCQVIVPASEATLATARLSLLATEKALPTAEKKVKNLSDKILKLENEIKLLKQKSADSEKLSEKELLLSATKNSQKLALKSLELTKKAIPKAVKEVKSAEARVKDVRGKCNK